MKSPLAQRYEIIIIGAGFAGASTAAALVSRGARSVLVVEAEAVPGHHASGRNAAMARRVIGDPVMARLATESVRGIRRSWPHLVSAGGGLLLGTARDIAQLHRGACAVPELAAEVQRWTLAQACAQFPVLEGASATDAIWSRGCGVVDIHGLLLAYIERARLGGAEFRYGNKVVGIERSAGELSGVVLSDGTAIRCAQVVNASGFAANRIARLAGVEAITAAAFRRHLFVTARLEEGGVDRSWPFIWDVSHGYYFRAEGDGLLMCACDQTEWLASYPDDVVTDPGMRELLAERFSEHAPRLSAARPRQCWAGLRVLTPDARFAIGPDRSLAGLFWVAALGGHGMTTSLAVGELAAEALLGRRVDSAYATAFNVERLRPVGQSDSVAHSAP